ncbi:MAG: hypothetical protein PUH05_01970, partial [Firmicutes bacterium]|nr:hypothetical protein [Bacillota bacterium]
SILRIAVKAGFHDLDFLMSAGFFIHSAQTLSSPLCKQLNDRLHYTAFALIYQGVLQESESFCVKTAGISPCRRSLFL